MALYSDRYPYEQQPLPYSYNDLEPIINSELLEFHYSEIMPVYFVRLNAALKNYPQYHNMSIVELIMNYLTLPRELQQDVLINAGGIYNHSAFFEGMIPQEIILPKGVLMDEINASFGSFNEMKNEFLRVARELYGAGYVALVRTRRRGLRIISIPNQDTAIRINLLPVIQIDLWEHAYVPQYRSRRMEYTEKWFSLVNWTIAEKRYDMDFNFRQMTR